MFLGLPEARGLISYLLVSFVQLPGYRANPFHKHALLKSVLLPVAQPGSWKDAV